MHIRTQLHELWSAVAPAWEAHAQYADTRGAAVTEAMLRFAAPQPGERVLELACGAGGAGLAAAQLCPGTEVVLSDVAPEMAAIAARRAAELRLANVTSRVVDLEEIDEPDDSFDVTLCREGLMFASDPAGATREIARVLRPDGRVAIAVWGPRELNPWLGVVLDAVGGVLGRSVPPPGIPGPFALEDRERLAALLSGAGLRQVAVTELSVPLNAASPDEWWARTSALAGPLSQILAALPDDAKAAIREHALQAARSYETADGLEFPGLTLLATGRAPDS